MDLTPSNKTDKRTDDKTHLQEKTPENVCQTSPEKYLRGEFCDKSGDGRCQKPGRKGQHFPHQSHKNTELYAKHRLKKIFGSNFAENGGRSLPERNPGRKRTAFPLNDVEFCISLAIRAYPNITLARNCSPQFGSQQSAHKRTSPTCAWASGARIPASNVRDAVRGRSCTRALALGSSQDGQKISTTHAREREIEREDRERERKRGGGGGRERKERGADPGRGDRKKSRGAPVLPVSSSSSITIGCSVSAMVASEKVASPEVGRGRSEGEALNLQPTILIGTWSASRPRGLIRSSWLGKHMVPKSDGALQVRHKASGGTRSSTRTTWAVFEHITFNFKSPIATLRSK